jgi:hypothetical protein
MVVIAVKVTFSRNNRGLAMAGLPEKRPQSKSTSSKDEQPDIGQGG